MSLFKVIIFLLIVSTVVIDSRALRKRRQDTRSSAYFGANALGTYPYVGYGLSLTGLGNNWYPLGNNWYMPSNLPYAYNNQFGYNQQLPYMSNYGYQNSFGTSQYGAMGFNSLYYNNGQPYTGQSYVPQSTEWLPLPGYDRRRRRRSLRNIIVPNMRNKLVLSTTK